MKLQRLFVYFSLLLTLSSCIEIIDDISLNEDGSGTFKYIINLNSSKVKINSILALDSLDGKKVPSIGEIEARISDFSTILSKKEGISNVSLSQNFNDYIFKLSCDFAHVDKLQSALKEVIREMSNERNAIEYQHKWIDLNNNKLVRSIPEFALNRGRNFKQEDLEAMRTGSYTSITRFSQNIASYTNSNAVISPNKKAIMVKTDARSLIENAKILENTIQLSSEK